MILDRKIWVTFTRTGFHCYPDAPDEVAYLRDRHRHVFHYKVSIDVAHNERDIEYHMFKNWILSLFDSGLMEANDKSCETLASDLALTIRRRYPGHWIEVDVSEDGECGSTITLSKE